jgi:hypothetical protein
VDFGAQNAPALVVAGLRKASARRIIALQKT